MIREGEYFFASLPSRRLCWWFVGNSEIKRGIFVWVWEIPRKSYGNDDCHIVRLIIWYHLFLEFWLVKTRFFAHWIHQHAVIRLKNVRQLNIRRGKKLSFQLPHGQPPAINLKTLILYGLKIQKSADHCGWQKWDVCQLEPIARLNIW